MLLVKVLIVAKVLLVKVLIVVSVFSKSTNSSKCF